MSALSAKGGELNSLELGIRVAMSGSIVSSVLKNNEKDADQFTTTNFGWG